MRQATLAPIATAPAVPPRTALFAALSRICWNVSTSSVGLLASPLIVVSKIGPKKRDSRSIKHFRHSSRLTGPTATTALPTTSQVSQIITRPVAAMPLEQKQRSKTQGQTSSSRGRAPKVRAPSSPRLRALWHRNTRICDALLGAPKIERRRGPWPMATKNG